MKEHALGGVRQFFANRFSPNTYVGLHLTVSLLVAVVAASLSTALLEAVLDNATVVRLDVSAAHWIHDRVSPRGMAVSRWISMAGSPMSVGVLAVVGGLVLLVRRRITLLITWIAVIAGGGAFERLLKSLVERTRPPFGAGEESPSFPSGHSMMTFLGVSMLVYAVLLPRRFEGPWRGVLMGLAAAFILCVGISRVYLGAHYPSDVIGGYAFGAAWMAICVGLRGIIKHQRDPEDGTKR